MKSKMLIKSKKAVIEKVSEKTGKKVKQEFRRYWTTVVIPCSTDSKGNKLEKVEERKVDITVKFVKELQSQLDALKIVRGILEGEFNLPYEYKVEKSTITKNTIDGKTIEEEFLVYPEIWVKSIDKFTPVMKEPKVKFILEDEEETDETEFESNDVVEDDYPLDSEE